MSDFYQLKAKLPSGETLNFADLKGKVALIVNTASRCGFAGQLEELEKIHKQYKDKGLVVIGFPSAQFLNKEPEKDGDIGAFCLKNYGVSFDLAAKSDVNGKDANEVFAYLKEHKKGFLGTSGIKWNFTKFLVDSNGRVVERFSPQTKPKVIVPKIEKALSVVAPVA